MPTIKATTIAGSGMTWLTIGAAATAKMATAAETARPGAMARTVTADRAAAAADRDESTIGFCMQAGLAPGEEVDINILPAWGRYDKKFLHRLQQVESSVGRGGLRR